MKLVQVCHFSKRGKAKEEEEEEEGSTFVPRHLCSFFIFCIEELFKFYFIVVCVVVLPHACLCVICKIHAWRPQRPPKGLRYPGTVVTDSCNLLRGCWISNAGPLEEQTVLLPTEPPLQPLAQNNNPNWFYIVT